MMSQMIRRVLSVVMACAFVACVSAPAFAQGGSTSSISGTVVDSSGGALPGATVEAKGADVGTVFTSVTSVVGSFVIPAVPTGTYTVKVSLQGFKSVTLNNVVTTLSDPANVKATLEIGGVSETVVVEATSTIVQTQATSVTSTINTRAIESLPLTSRNVIDFLTFLPGVNVAGTNRQANVNGLPGSAVNITLDGVNIQDNTLKSTDGFFTIVQPRLDAIEEVSITGAAAGATDGQGAITVKFVTRSGTNRYTGSAYEYYRNDKFNQNTWFNKRDGVAKPKLRLYQTGTRFGGPIQVPGIFNGRNRAFFFFNVENSRQPADTSRTRTILSPAAQTGTFRYTAGGGVTQVNVLQLAAANGQLATMDPTIQKLLADIRAAATSTGSITDATDPLYQNFNYNTLQKSNNWFPTFRWDVNIGQNHHWSTVYNHDVFATTPDVTTNNREPTFPGFPVFGSQTSLRISVSNTLRSTFGRNLVNEARFAVQGSPVVFYPELDDNRSLWDGPVANQKGFQLSLNSTPLTLTNAGSTTAPQSRNVKVFNYEDTLNWLKGNHSVQAGLAVTDLRIWLKNQTVVPTVTFGMINADPALGMFTVANFPGASSANLTAARVYYALLTGRVSQITGNARIDETSGNYVYQGKGIQRGRMTEFGLYGQDNWRVRRDLTINYGVRYEIQGPFSAANSLYSYATPADAFGVSGLSSTCDPDEPTAQTCNLFKPGTLPGTTPYFKQLTSGTKAYNTDLNNVAPSVGVSWAPTGHSAFARGITGEDGQFVLRGGFTRAYTRNGLNDYTGVFNANPGITISVNKSESLGNLGSNLVLLRNDAQVAPGAFPEKPTYPLSGVSTDSVNAFAQNLRQPYADSYTFGVQRGVSKNMAVEVRYIGTRSRDSITTYNLNGENNVNENNFVSEFRNAQANLQANIASGRGATFRYFGAGTGTVPLPIFQAYFSGVAGANAGNEALYTSANYTNATFVNPLAAFAPNVFTEANALQNVAAQRASAIAAGLASNFFIANPNYTGGANITGNGGYTRYNAVQVELRRRLASGIQFQANYNYGVGFNSQRYSFRVPRKDVASTGSGGDVTHAVKANVVFELPFGQGHRFAANAGPVLDRIIGGWQINLNARIQSGRLIDFGNVRMVGFTAADLQDMYQLRIDSTNRVYVLPEAVINETIKAFSVSATSATGYGSLGAPSGKYFAPPTGPTCLETTSQNYGDCGPRTTVVRGPRLQEFDLNFVKSVRLVGHVRGEFRAELLNAFNNVNYVPVGGCSGTNALAAAAACPTTVPGYEITTLTGINTSRIMELVWRVSW